MLDGEFSQEVENSSNSTRNSRDMKILKKLILESDEKIRFFRNAKISRDSKRILQNVNKAETLAQKTEESPTVLPFCRLPLVEKKDFIENWFLSNEANFLGVSPQKSSPLGPESPNKRQKRLARSPMSSCVGKRHRSQNFDLPLGPKSKSKENRQFDGNHCQQDGTLLENDASLLESSSLTSCPSYGPGRTFPPQSRPGEPNPVIGRARNSEILAPASPVVIDTKIGRYSWNGRNFPGRNIPESSGNWRESFGRPSSSTLREESPLRWTGYERRTVASKQEKCPPAQNKSFSSNLCPFKENNWRKLSPESPLRWNGYEIRDSSPSSSILFGTGQGEDFSNRKEIIYSPTSSGNVNKILSDSEGGSPLRCVEYQPQIRDVHKLALSQTLSSPMNEAERIIDPSSSSESDEILIFEDENSSREGNSGNSRMKRKKLSNFQVETPRRLNGCRFTEFSKLPEVSLSISDPELASLLPAMPGHEEPVLDLGSEKSSGNFRLLRKTRPVKLETIFGSEVDEIAIPGLADAPETRAVSTAMPETEAIEVEPSKVGFTEEDSKIDVESESGSDRTIGNDIEDIFTQNTCPTSRRAPILIDKEEANLSPRNIDPEGSDSDATYFSDGEPGRHETRENNCSPEPPRIARDLSTFSRNRSEIISQASSPRLNQEQIIISVPTVPPPRNTNKRTKKAKQGSLAARLQYLVNFQISDRQIWRYRKARADWQDSRSQFVKLRIREGEMRYSRCFLLASPIEDEHKLLDDLCACGEARGSPERAVRLMIVPEISGTMEIRKNCIMKIYPPWKIMDRGNKLLNVIYFEVLAQDDQSNFHPRPSVERERILQSFDCLCLTNQAIDRSCCVKFTNTKPNVIREMFFDPE